MTEWEKAQNGYLYDANYDKELIELRTRCADLCFEFNNCRPFATEKQKLLLGRILGNPCRVIREITEADKQKYPIFDESI